MPLSFCSAFSLALCKPSPPSWLGKQSPVTWQPRLPCTCTQLTLAYGEQLLCGACSLVAHARAGVHAVEGAGGTGSRLSTLCRWVC
jgi:hypothetical protein